MKQIKNILLSFVGSNDAGKLIGQNDGAILTALANQKFDEVILLWNRAKVKEVDYAKISSYLKNEILKRKLSREVTLVEQKIKDVTDHNEIYLSLKTVTDQLSKNESLNYTAAISSGTPAMQVCWILLAESGDFSQTNPLKLIKVKDPKFGKSENIPVKIDTSLPRIVRLKEEVENLKDGFLPAVKLNVEKGEVFIGNLLVSLSPIEFCYYRYFLELVIEEKSTEKISSLETSLQFVEKIYQFHEESFPVLDLGRDELRKLLKDKMGIAISTFRGNVSKINRKIRSALNDKNLSNYYELGSTGKRGAKFYGINLPSKKIKIA
jgi:uncharacterized phage-associated protein